MHTVQIEMDRYDDANLRLTCAQSILTMFQILTGSEGADSPSNSVLHNALFGVGMLLEDAQRQLNA